jgi:hypothetical protein
MSNLISNEEVSNTQHLASPEEKSAPEDGIGDSGLSASKTKDETREKRCVSGGQRDTGYEYRVRYGYKNAPPLGGRKRWW